MSDTTAASPLTLDIDRADGVAVVHCHGRLVAGMDDVLYNQVRQLFPDNKRIVMDLTDLSHVDSMGLGALVRLYVSAGSGGCELELLNLGQQVRQLFRTTNMMLVFTVVDEQGVKTG